MNTTRLLGFIGLGLLTASTLCAQPPGRGGDGRGDGRGGDGYRGGGPPGGGFGDRGRGGPPGGGFGDRGGPPSFGGGPSDFLARLDRNGNGMIDPDEQTGPAQFLIPRLASVDPEIKAGQPISVKRLAKAFDKMRQERDGGGGDPRRDSSGSSSARDDALLPELLVPGFGSEEEPDPLMGFGATAELLSVKVTPDDQREAAERMRRYDRNRDGFLTKDELSSRFSGNPMDFDRNRDGRLSESELAVRYARRREGEEEAKGQSREADRRRDSRRSEIEIPDVYSGRKSYRNQSTKKLPDGLPGFFTDKDADGDGQVTMAEYSSDWSDELVDEFFKSDLNRDGAITAYEATRAVERGVSTPTPSMFASSSRGPSSSPGPSVKSGSQPKDMSKIESTGGKPDPKLVTYAERIISRYDKNKDKSLTASEWKSMLMNPAPADGNRDGRVTVEEYAMWMQSRSKR